MTCARILGRDLNCLPNQSGKTNVTPTESLTDISGVPFTWSHAEALRPSRFWEEAQGVWHPKLGVGARQWVDGTRS
ncbi:MAG: hypothetical protein KGR25_08390, partial [Chloroflexi bacterium]|nr:hypothetical protein [Chloroflexota bacterium]